MAWASCDSFVFLIERTELYAFPSQNQKKPLEHSWAEVLTDDQPSWSWGSRDKVVEVLWQCILTVIRHIFSLKRALVLSTEVFGGQVTVISQFATILGLQGCFRHFGI